MADKDTAESLARIEGQLEGMPDKFELAITKGITKHEKDLHPRKPLTSIAPKNGDRAALMSLLKYALYVIGAAVMALGGKALL